MMQIILILLVKTYVSIVLVVTWPSTICVLESLRVPLCLSSMVAVLDCRLKLRHLQVQSEVS